MAKATLLPDVMPVMIEAALVSKTRDDLAELSFLVRWEVIDLLRDQIVAAVDAGETDRVTEKARDLAERTDSMGMASVSRSARALADAANMPQFGSDLARLFLPGLITVLGLSKAVLKREYWPNNLGLT